MWRRSAIALGSDLASEIIEQPLADLYLPGATDLTALTGARPAAAVGGARADGRTTPLREGSFAVCRMAEARWRGCRIEAVGTEIKVVDDDALYADLTWRDILAPTAVTELNVRQKFERNAKRRAFREGAKNAGRPRMPSGWRPTLNERVLAERDGSWMSAEVRGSRKGSVRIQWDSDHRSTDTTESALSPEPPVDFVPTVGIYVLTRPSAGARAWSIMRVETAGERELGLSNEVGDRFQLPARDVVPLERRGR